MIIDGRAMAKEILARTRARVSRAGRGAPLVVALTSSDTPATLSYLSIKTKKAEEAGCILEIKRFPTDVSTAALCAAVLSADADTIIVQLPLPAGFDTKAVCDAIPVLKDADVLSSVARAKFERGDADALLPPVVGAVREIFLRNNVKLKGKRTIMIGDGWLVGNPCAKWLIQQGAEVEVINKPSDFAVARATLATADIIVSGAGSPHLIKPEMLKPGVVLIDAGTSESGGTIAGDADPSCAEVCSIFTPVPGGVGQLAVACLFANVVTLAERKV